MGLRDEAKAAAGPATTSGSGTAPVANGRHGVPDSSVYVPETGATTDGTPASQAGALGNRRRTEPDPEETEIVHTQGTWEALPQPDYTNSGLEPTPRDATVYQAWQAVMAEVQAIAKGDRFVSNSANYDYRGIDAVVNAVGPALRKHGVAIFPVETKYSYRDVTVGKYQTAMREVTASVRYEIVGPQGDRQVAASQGESLDSGDKGSTKANTVAFRNLLLTALAVPVQMPNYDPDRVEYRRSRPTAPALSGDDDAVPLPKPAHLRDEALESRTPLARLRAIYQMVHRRGGEHPHLGSAMVINEVGDEEPLDRLVYRQMQARKNGGETS